MDRGACWARVHEVAKGLDPTEQLNSNKALVEMIKEGIHFTFKYV